MICRSDSVHDRDLTQGHQFLILAERCQRLGIVRPSEKSVADIVAIVYRDAAGVSQAGPAALNAVREFKRLDGQFAADEADPVDGQNIAPLHHHWPLSHTTYMSHPRLPDSPSPPHSFWIVRDSSLFNFFRKSRI